MKDNMGKRKHISLQTQQCDLLKLHRIQGHVQAGPTHILTLAIVSRAFFSPPQPPGWFGAHAPSRHKAQRPTRLTLIEPSGYVALGPASVCVCVCACVCVCVRVCVCARVCVCV
jgi:hypothetical protein